mmetsp:Transcript_45973/g.144007  ORF Transcript_45973/g.144007 Transcript_45973/m.144007 type:complete len:239 (-) Transcript_45973:2-718(-)
MWDPGQNSVGPFSAVTSMSGTKMVRQCGGHWIAPIAWSWPKRWNPSMCRSCASAPGEDTTAPVKSLRASPPRRRRNSGSQGASSSSPGSSTGALAKPGWSCMSKRPRERWTTSRKEKGCVSMSIPSSSSCARHPSRLSAALAAQRCTSDGSAAPCRTQRPCCRKAISALSRASADSWPAGPAWTTRSEASHGCVHQWPGAVATSADAAAAGCAAPRPAAAPMAVGGAAREGARDALPR